MNTFEQRRQITHYRAAFHDMPVMGPMDGAAYGEYLKSKALGMVIGVVASVVTMGAALPLMASTVLATQIAGGVMMAGGVMSGVGAVTGNKKLMKIGGIMSLAGGVGALASGALNAAGTGGAFASGSGSEAVSSMANSFMDSASSMTGGLVYGDRVAGAAGAAADQEFAMNKAFNAGSPAPAAGEFTVPQPEVTTPGQIDPAGGVSADGTIAQRGADGQIQLAGGGDDATVKLLQERAGTVAKPGEITPAGAERAGESTMSRVAGADKTAMAYNEANPAGNATVTGTPNKPAVPPAGSDKVAGAASDKLFMGMDKTELLKTGAGLLEKGAAAAFAPDEEEKMAAVTDYYKANTTKLTTENEILQWKKDNAGKQVAMIAANAPDMEQQVAAAKAAGHPIAFIPSVAANGVTPTNGGANMAAPKANAVAAQTPVRQPTTAMA